MFAIDSVVTTDRIMYTTDKVVGTTDGARGRQSKHLQPTEQRVQMTE